MSALPEDLLNLSVEERLRLVDDLWESIRQNPESLPVTDDQREELEQRLNEHRSDPHAAEPMSSVLERIRNRN